MQSWHQIANPINMDTAEVAVHTGADQAGYLAFSRVLRLCDEGWGLCRLTLVTVPPPRKDEVLSFYTNLCSPDIVALHFYY